MANLKIEVFKNSSTGPETTIKIPLDVLKVASKLMPKNVMSSLEEKGIDINHLLYATQKEKIQGILVEIEEHTKNERVVISVG
jgi:hypothetical protein